MTAIASIVARQALAIARRAASRRWYSASVRTANVIADTVIDLVGTIGRHVLANLLPDRRLRVCPRIVKRAISKYQARGTVIDRTSYQATLAIDILTSEPP